MPIIITIPDIQDHIIPPKDVEIDLQPRIGCVHRHSEPRASTGLLPRHSGAGVQDADSELLEAVLGRAADAFGLEWVRETRYLVPKTSVSDWVDEAVVEWEGGGPHLREEAEGEDIAWLLAFEAGEDGLGWVGEETEGRGQEQNSGGLDEGVDFMMLCSSSSCR